MPITIPTSREFFFLGNPIAITLQDTEVANFVRFLYAVSVGAVASEEYEAYRFGGSTQAIINLKAILKGFFDMKDYPLPDLTSNSFEVLNNQTAICKPFTLTAESEYTTGSPSTTTRTGYAMIGGFPYRKHPSVAEDFFLQARPNTYIILNPYTSKKTDPQQKEFLYFTNIFLNNVPEQIYFQYFLSKEGNEDFFGGAIDLTHLQKGKTSCIDVSYAKIIADSAVLDIITKIKIKIIAVYTALDYEANLFTFDIDHAHYAQKHYFLYLNTFGGMSTIRLTGQRKTEFETTQSEANEYVSPTYTMPAVPSRIINKQSQEKFTIESGYQFETYEEARQFKDFFQSTLIYEISGTDLLPVKINTKKIATLDDDLTEIPNTKLEFEYLFDSDYEV